MGLVGLLGKIKDADEKAKMEAELKDAVQGDLDDDEEEETPQFVVSESDLASTRPFNQRIHLPSGHDDMGDDDMMDDGGEGATKRSSPATRSRRHPTVSWR